jgi:hypothetical protein
VVEGLWVRVRIIVEVIGVFIRGFRLWVRIFGEVGVVVVGVVIGLLVGGVMVMVEVEVGVIIGLMVLVDIWVVVEVEEWSFIFFKVNESVLVIHILWAQLEVEVQPLSSAELPS